MLSVLKKNEKQFFEMFQLRHKVVHTMQTPKECNYDPDYFYTLWDTSHHFLNLVFTMAENMMDFKERNLKNKDLKMFFSKKVKEFKQDKNDFKH